MTQPQPAPLVDLEELERQLSADVHAEDYKCPRCECMTTGDNESESVFCQDCAYDVAENVVPLLLQELRMLRAERAHLEEAARLCRFCFKHAVENADCTDAEADAYGETFRAWIAAERAKAGL